MKRLLFCICLLSVTFLFYGCDNKKTEAMNEVVNVSEDYETIDESNYLSWETFDNLDELTEYIAENADVRFKSVVERTSSNLKNPKFPMYKLSNIPNGYDLNKVALSGNFISMDYLNDAAQKNELIIKNDMSKNDDKHFQNDLEIYDSELSSYPDESSMNDLKKSTNSNNMSKITFVWGYNTEGDEYLKNAINIFGLKPMPNISNYYYSEAVDDYGVDIYQIYWSKDGYCFQLNIPSKIFNNFNNYRVNGIKSFKHSDLLDIEKTEYDIAAIAK